MADEKLSEYLENVRRLVAEPVPRDPVELVETLARVSTAIALALDEAMAQAAVAGASSRLIADAAGVAPNSVPPRLARSAALAAYAEDGKVSAEGIAAARFTQRQQLPTAPRFTFTPRKRSEP